MAEPALSIRGLTKVYGNGFQALKGIDLDVQQGDFFALLGPNGAGKSTTLGVVCSLVQKTAGKVSIFGIDIDKDFAKAKYQLGVVPQEFNFNQFEKVLDIVLAQAGYYGMKRSEALPRAKQLLTDLGLWEKRNGSARMLSGGMKRRLMIARALMHRPKLLILDEPTAGVDIELRRSMWEYMRRINRDEGTTIKKPRACAAISPSSTMAKLCGTPACASCWRNWTPKPSYWISPSRWSKCPPLKALSCSKSSPPSWR